MLRLHSCGDSDSAFRVSFESQSSPAGATGSESCKMNLRSTPLAPAGRGRPRESESGSLRVLGFVSTDHQYNLNFKLNLKLAMVQVAIVVMMMAVSVTSSAGPSDTIFMQDR